jgi:septal ring factor EnvC (AmiA/AmiB activator)
MRTEIINDRLQLQNESLKLLLEKSNNDKSLFLRQLQDSEASLSTLKNSFIAQKAELDSLRKINADLNFVISQVAPSSVGTPSKKRTSAGPGQLEFTPPLPNVFRSI